MKKLMYALSPLLILSSCFWGSSEKKNTQAQFLVMNVLDQNLYDDAHIKGSVNVPFADVVDYAERYSKDIPIVTYCSNYACSASGVAAQMLLERGFKHVWAYEGGMAEWYQLNYPYEGPAKQAYLKAANPKPEHLDTSVPVISSEELKEKMKEYNLV